MLTLWADWTAADPGLAYMQAINNGIDKAADGEAGQEDDCEGKHVYSLKECLEWMTGWYGLIRVNTIVNKRVNNDELINDELITS